MRIKFQTQYCCVTLLVLAICLSQTWAQDRACINQLAPCLNYLNGTRSPPDTCCDPLKSVIKSNPKCLCSLASNKGTRQAEQAGININEAQQLPGRCGQHVNPLSCLTNSPGSKNSVPNSASKFRFLSWGVLVIMGLSVTLQMLWGSS
ncbi:Lipid transfer protein [Quillaja saponaria]|uniref:Lipid transfer protein n=1 Tax=Quillaja saponaria TaxID=32244 RepID=A0AAD7VDN0_QUISA|nr:Lipid transfer protein [Quillaja saponaria]